MLILVAGCSGTTREEEGDLLPVVPGKCLKTDCTWPAAQPFVPAPVTVCEPTQGPPISVEWNTQALETECQLGECVAAPFDVAVGADGEVWTSARLLPKTKLDIEDPIGFELLRNGAGGQLELEQLTHEEQPLYEPTLDATGMSVTANGELDWLGPAPSSPGLALLHYDRAGVRTSASWLIEHAQKSLARFTSHGITVAYRYIAGTDASVDPPKITSRVGVARFDPTGALRWNQAGFTKATPALDHVSAMGVGPDGAVSLVLHQAPPVEEGSGQLLVRLAPDGHVAWARWMDHSTWLGAVRSTDGTLIVSGWDNKPAAEDSSRLVEAIDANGDGIWRTSYSPSFASVTLALSDEERIFLPDVFSDQPALILSADGATCTQHALDLQMFLPIGTEFYTTDPGYAALPNERFGFAYSGRFGVLGLP